MPKLIFLTGMVGAGKSTLAKRFEGRCYYIRGDAIHQDSARRAFPYRKIDQELSWRAWPVDAEGTMHMASLLKKSFKATHPDIAKINSFGNVLVDGAIFCNDWYWAPFVESLAKLGFVFKKSDIHLVYLRPPAEQVHDQILARADSIPDRTNEKQLYALVEKVERGMNGINTIIKRSRGDWVVCNSTDEAAAFIESLLAPRGASLPARGKGAARTRPLGSGNEEQGFVAFLRRLFRAR